MSDVECGSGLDVLTAVRGAYEDRLDLIERMGGRNKQKLILSTLRSWVSDLMAQNSLLARTVEKLELEATSRVQLETRRNQEMSRNQSEMKSLRCELAKKSSDLKNLIKLLRILREKEDISFTDLHFYYVTNSDIYGHEFELQDGIIQYLVGLGEEQNGVNQLSRDIILLLSLSSGPGTRTNGVSEQTDELGISIQDSQKENLVKERYATNVDVVPVKSSSSCQETKSRRSCIQMAVENNVELIEKVQELHAVSSALLHECRTSDVKDKIIWEMRKKLIANKEDMKDSGSEIGARADRVARSTSGPALYHDQLISTMQILQNQKETLRVQCESLHVAESRIADLTLRNSQLRAQLEEKTRQLTSLRQSLENNITTVERQPSPEIDSNKELVKSLQEHISVIEELYRESFYESAKQDNIIDTLRRSNVDVRLIESQKNTEIDQLQSIVHSQRTSLERCQEIADEVDNLKSEIWHFLNSSNNDSGVWDRSEDSLGTELGDDLHDIMHQLIQLRQILIEDCSNEDSMSLKKTNESLQSQVEELNRKIEDLENTVSQNNIQIKQHNELMRKKDEELLFAQEHVRNLEEGSRTTQTLLQQQKNINNKLQTKLNESQGELREKTSELQASNCLCLSREETIQQLQEQLQQLEREKCQVESERHTEVSMLHAHLNKMAERERDSSMQLAAAKHHNNQLEDSYKEKVSFAKYLQRELCAATEQGAELCAESRRVLATLPNWISTVRSTHRKQTHKIRQNEKTIRHLKQKLEYEDTSDDTCPCRSKKRQSDVKHMSAREMEQPSNSRAREGQKEAFNDRIKEREHSTEKKSDLKHIRAREMELPSCSRTRKGQSIYERMKESERSSSVGRDWRKRGVSRVETKDIRNVHCIRTTPEPPLFFHEDNFTTELSPFEDLQMRVLHLQEAFADGQRRWARHTHR